MNNKPPCLTDWVNRCGSHHLVDWKAWRGECARYERERAEDPLGGRGAA
jgi:hypothetical protein